LECVQRVLALNPQHEKAHEHLEDLQALATSSAAPQAQPPAQPPAPSWAGRWRVPKSM
jgi:hypothetical protein